MQCYIFTLMFLLSHILMIVLCNQLFEEKSNLTPVGLRIGSVHPKSMFPRSHKKTLVPPSQHHGEIHEFTKYPKGKLSTSSIADLSTLRQKRVTTPSYRRPIIKSNKTQANVPTLVHGNADIAKDHKLDLPVETHNSKLKENKQMHHHGSSLDNKRSMSEAISKDVRSKESQQTKKIIKRSTLLPEEELDRIEFIFVGEKVKTVEDMLEIDTHRVADSHNRKTRDSRVKRSSNIIMEENLGTTVSGFKFTRRDTRLNNEMYFKNINS